MHNLTGKKTTPKKIKGTFGTEKNDFFHLKKNIFQEQCEDSHSHASTVVDEHFFTEELRENKYDAMGPFAKILEDSLEENGVQVCDSSFWQIGRAEFL